MTHLKKLISALIILIIILGISVGWWISHRFYGGVPTTETPLSTFKSQLSTKQMTIKAVGLGDSLTKGVGDPNEQGYAGIVVGDLRKESAFSSASLIDEGVTGDTTKDLLKVLKKKQVQDAISKSNVIFLTIGGNDLVNVLKDHFLNLDFKEFDKAQKQYTQNLNTILTKVRALNPTATIYYMGLYNPFEDYLTDLNQPFESVLNKWNQAGETILSLYPNTVFIPTFDLFHGKTSELLYKDHFHPNPKGYKLIASRILTHFDQSPSQP
ncbi:GDSL-type esterase/lipase family protein [Pullulanibacillus sp. KACC 23026]|uniref:GDSL-type esterase/lipase family protein n=1 Tax=Pullulanibacillus sp. KACC 23026 TaxID=3028315 RepID=UPI0023AF2E7C|nr:GDSL-type esterase/lipase family protein [Pullulanibacillus sp. KACC 23026]WEG10876.1 GDSL-type esterase/lipase family protein [Pullulanibacillus sp. KACC 23026]